ncbi:hypothetical protein V8G54_035303 [Vigna mungo]|uniref:Uncharacterized protein n=1 Tax=Vigna mungo TaxID=3915 RepID=A0AAQ3MGB3_VIGMU
MANDGCRGENCGPGPRPLIPLPEIHKGLKHLPSFGHFGKSSREPSLSPTHSRDQVSLSPMTYHLRNSVPTSLRTATTSCCPRRHRRHHTPTEATAGHSRTHRPLSLCFEKGNPGKGLPLLPARCSRYHRTGRRSPRDAVSISLHRRRLSEHRDAKPLSVSSTDATPRLLLLLLCFLALIRVEGLLPFGLAASVTTQTDQRTQPIIVRCVWVLAAELH